MDYKPNGQTIIYDQIDMDIIILIWSNVQTKCCVPIKGICHMHVIVCNICMLLYITYRDIFIVFIGYCSFIIERSYGGEGSH